MSSDIHLRAISWELPNPLIWKRDLKISFLKFYWCFPRVNEFVTCWHQLIMSLMQAVKTSATTILTWWSRNIQPWGLVEWTKIIFLLLNLEYQMKPKLQAVSKSHEMFLHTQITWELCQHPCWPWLSPSSNKTRWTYSTNGSPGRDRQTSSRKWDTDEKV